ncbi:MAG: hypothetical protein WCI51_10905 [Lentisphaerota bacterium]
MENFVPDAIPIEIKHKSGRKLIIAPEVIDGANTEAESPVQSALVMSLARAGRAVSDQAPEADTR